MLVLLLSTLAGGSLLQDASDLVAKMNLTEKVSLLQGEHVTEGTYTGVVPGVPRLNIPRLLCNDGPQGFRGPDDTSTQWVSSLHAAASWDIKLVEKWAQAMATEFVDKGANVILGPGLNIHRVPQGGRNFEYLSGEDPHLGARLGAAYVSGAVSKKILATPKHYLFNNQEINRTLTSAIVDEVAKHEIYLPPFLAAVKAGSGSVMCSYNKINGTYSCENEALLAEMHYKLVDGFVMSDWGATHPNSFQAGLDMAMPWSHLYDLSTIKAGMENGTITQQDVDSKALRIVSALMDHGLPDNSQKGNWNSNVTSSRHNNLNRLLAEQGTILLKNGGMLPLNPNDDSTAAVRYLGCDHMHLHGGGSGQVIQRAVSLIGGVEALGVPHASIANATQIGEKDIVVVCGSTTAQEGSDRPSLALAEDDEMLIYEAAILAHRTIVVLSTPGSILMPWADIVDSILLSFLPGAQGGIGLANVLYGFSEPTGRLPVTIPHSKRQLEFAPSAYPGIDNVVQYTEGLEVGYRWFQARGADYAPVFPFGFGLSYTRFSYSKASIHHGDDDDTQHDADCFHVSAQLTVTNEGPRDGHTVPQLYVQVEGRPFRQLHAFTKLFLKRGDSTTVYLTCDPVLVWDASRHRWRPPRGTMRVSLATSSSPQHEIYSRPIRCKNEIEVLT